MFTDKKVFIISSPSGTGKTTLNKMLVKKHLNIEIAVSYTTRPKRFNEIDGKDYFFVDKASFEEAIANEEMLEWANVHGHLYGTCKKEIERIIKTDHIPLLEIDTQGRGQIIKKLSNTFSIFILPPDLKHLWERLEDRGTDSLEVRWRRLLNAREEIKKAFDYDCFIINNTLREAFIELEDVVIAGKNPTIDKTIGKKKLEQLLTEFNESAWINKAQ